MTQCPPMDLTDPRMSEAEANPLYAIEFASERHVDAHDFLRDWQLGNITDWPEYRHWIAANHG